MTSRAAAASVKASPLFRGRRQASAPRPTASHRSGGGKSFDERLNWSVSHSLPAYGGIVSVSSAMRRATWEAFPFADDLIMSEDQEWSRRVLRAGFELAYVADAVVHHSHSYSVAAAFRRFFDSGVSAERSYAAGGTGSSALRRAGGRYAKGEVEWLWRTGQRRWIPYAAVYELAKFAGMQLGRRHRRLPRSLNRRFTALQAYWD